MTLNAHSIAGSPETLLTHETPEGGMVCVVVVQARVPPHVLRHPRQIGDWPEHLEID